MATTQTVRPVHCRKRSAKPHAWQWLPEQKLKHQPWDGHDRLFYVTYVQVCTFCGIKRADVSKTECKHCGVELGNQTKPFVGSRCPCCRTSHHEVT